MLPKIDELGAIDDRVSIRLNDEEIRITESYEVKQSFLTQPAAFSARVGNGDLTRELMARFPPGIPYGLYIGGILQHSGALDEFAPEGSSGATELNLRGRDSLAVLHDDHTDAEKSFRTATFLQLTEACIQGAGIVGYSIVSSNDANRAAITAGPLGVKKPRIREGVTVVSAPTADGQPSEATKKSILAAVAAQKAQQAANQADAVLASINESKPPTEKPLQIKIGQTWYEFLKKELDRAGLFLFAGVDENTFILTCPETTQPALYRVARQRGAARNAVNILTARHRDSTTKRHARYVVYGRGGGEAAGRTKTRGEFVDEEMIELGFAKRWCKTDEQVKTQAQADFLARRACAEARRESWELVYTVQGHTAPVLASNGRQRAVWAVDTIVEVFDDEYGIYGLHWIEGVTFRRGQDGTYTDLNLMRLEDLVFGEPDGYTREPVKRKGRRGWQNKRAGT
jgi:prophage tail gpP-like protein